MGRFKSKGNKAILYPTKLDHLKLYLFSKNLLGEVEDHALIRSKLSKQGVKSIRTLIFTM